MLTVEEIRAAKAVLFSPTSSWPDIESACRVLLSEANPTFPLSFFASTISPVLQHLLTSFPSPNPGDRHTLCVRLPTFSAICKCITGGPFRTNTFNTTIEVILPSFMKWAIFVLDMEIRNTNPTPREVIHALIMICTIIEIPLAVLTSEYPHFGPALVAAYVTRLNRYTGPSFLSNETHLHWQDVNIEIMFSVERDPVRKPQFIATAPQIASVSVAALVKAITARPLGYSYLRDVLHSMEHLVTVGSISYALYKDRIVDWCIHTLWLLIRASRCGDSIPQDFLEDIIYASLLIPHILLSSLGRTAIEQSTSLRIFDALARLKPLVSRSTKLQLLICAFLMNLSPFVVYTGVLLPAVRAIRRNSFEWLGEEGQKFTHFVREMYEARCEYGSEGKHTCWGHKCPYFNYGGPAGGETPRCAECSQCRHAAYCGAKCQKETWKDHRTNCRKTQLLKDNTFVEDDNGSIIKVNPVPLRAKETGFLFFLATKTLNANIDIILAHFFTADFSAYMHAGACISTDPDDPRAIVIEPTSTVNFGQEVPPGDIRVQVLAPLTKSSVERVNSVRLGAMLQLPPLEQLKNGLGTSHPRIVRMRCRSSENPVGRWRLDV